MPCIREPSRARMPVSKERQRSPTGYLRKTGDADMLDRRLGDLYDKYLKPSPYEMEKATQARHRVDWKGALAASVAAVPAPADWTSTGQRTRDRRKARFLWRDGSTARSR
jgi:hypothetical protein